jgi:hypothetical protein
MSGKDFLDTNLHAAHLTDLKREHLIDQVCIQGILHPNKRKKNHGSSGISATPVSNVMALRQKERISDTNRASRLIQLDRRV